MKLRTRLWTVLILAAVLATPAFGQSAKTGAATSSLTLIQATQQTFSFDPILRSYIHVPQQKELIFDVSLQCGLYTDTLVKSKGGGKDTSSAEATIAVRVAVTEILGVDSFGQPILGATSYAGPGEGGINENGVVFCSRTQTLSAKLQGIIENLACFPDGVFDPNAPGCELEFEEIQLVLETLNANAFNFVMPNLISGDYMVTAEAEVRSSIEVQNGSAQALGLVGLGSMVVDEVRFVQGSDGSSMP